MKKHLFLNAWFITILCTSCIFAQSDLKHCGADELRITTLQQHPAIAKAVIKRDEELEKFTAQFVEKFYNKQVSTATYIIPVVFHVIHNYGNENISDAQIIDGLNILNKTFRKQLADTANIIPAFKPLHADCDIEFRLAKLDPNGNCTSGINRIASPLTTIGDHSVKSLIHWPPNKYLNIYIVAHAAGLAGHCVWPSDADTIPLWDGIVMQHNYVGSIGTSVSSIPLAHECGHYLNLHHIWGGNNVPGFYYYPVADPNKDCNIDDLVADTPPTIGWQTCNLSGASCGNTVDNVQNVMDYSYCNRMFTYGQKARMQACLNSPIAGRNNLWQPANLIATGVDTTFVPTLCKADFNSNKNVVCSNSNNTITFTNTSYNGVLTAVSWTFPGGTPTTSTLSNPIVSYSTPGIYDVTLKVIAGNDSIAITKQSYITVLENTGNAYPFTEDFETISTLQTNGWNSNSFDTINQWEITNDASYNGTKSVYLSNFNNPQSTKDELYSKMFNLSGSSGLGLSFKYAYANKDTSNTARLQVFISNNCNTSWLQRINLTGTTLETAPLTTTSFVPTDASQWKQAFTAIPGTYANSSFRFIFVFTSNGGNNIYIDDINLDINSGINNLSDINTTIQVFPNPANENVNVTFTLAEEKKIQIAILNLLGQTVYSTNKTSYSTGEHSVSLDIKSLPNGMYFVAVSDDTNTTQKTVVITK